jgi:hypothetical protein
MTVTAAAVKARCLDPIIQATDDAVITSLIAEVERRTSRTQWGEKADDGVIYLTAHMALMNAKAAAGQSTVKGPLTSETVGPLSRSFAAPVAMPFSQQWYAQTSWGLMYWGLMSLVLSQRTDFDGSCW